MNKKPDATAKRRRLIVNDDGETGFGEKADTVEEYLDARFNDCRDTHVDAYFFNIGATDRGPVQGGKPILRPQSTMANFYYGGKEGEVHPRLDEAIRATIQGAHDAGMEIFASIRMNDCHNYQGIIETTYPLKTQRPDLVIGEIIDRGAYPETRLSAMDRFWLSLNYAKEEVREHFLNFILTHCRQYDYDGVELDFLREGIYFRYGEEAQNIPTMNEFVSDVRSGLEELGKERGRPYNLAIRVYDTPDQGRRAGLDAVHWLEEGWMDLLMVGGGYMPAGDRIKTFIDLAHQNGVPAYPSINNFKEPIRLRSWASNFWALGADGVYLFNWYGLKHYGLSKDSDEAACLSQMGDPEVLLGLDKLYEADNGDSYAWHGFNNQPPQFPVRLLDGKPIRLVAGDDLNRADEKGLIGKIELRLDVDHLEATESVRITINDHPIPQEDIERTGGDTFEAPVPARAVKRGANEIVVLPGPGSMGRLASVVTAAALSVIYS